MADIINTALSGLQTSQRTLATISHNIANVNTDGFSRQRIESSARIPQQFGNGYIGTGVQAQDVTRSFSDFLFSQLTDAGSATSRLDTIYSMASQIDNVLADDKAGLGPALQEFFNAVQEVSNDPSSVPARQILLSNAQTLAERFEDINAKFNTLRDTVKITLNSEATEINSIASSLAILNKNITLFGSGGNGAQPNDLLDQRNELIRKLSEKVAVSTVDQGDGSVNVFIGNGQPLVLGTVSGTLTITPSVFDPQIPEISFGIAGSTSVVTNNITGGIMGGALEFQNRILKDAANSLGRIALALSSDFNAQHRLGVDLNGDVGGSFFADISQNSNGILGPAIGASNSNVGTAQLDARIVDTNALSNSDYRISYNAGNYIVERLSDSTITSFPETAFPQTVDGVQLSFVSGTAVTGDVFLLRPTRNASADFALQIAHADEIAAASPINTNTPISNAGTATLNGLTVNSSTSMPLPSPITLTYDAINTEFDVSGIVPAGATGNPSINYDPVTDSAGITATIRIPTASAANVGAFAFTDAATADTLEYNLRINGFDIPLPVNGGGAGANTPNFTEGEAVPTLTELATAINGQSGTTGVEAFVSGGTLYLRNTATNNSDIVISERLVGASDTTDAATGFFGGAMTGNSPSQVTTLPATGQMRFTLAGVPQAGDVITLSNNATGVGDNRNALALAGLQSNLNMLNGTANYGDAYGEILVAVGSDTRQTQISLSASTILLRQANEEMQSVSGVNLDEEGANLLLYQQAYQASAQVISIASSLFDTLLQVVAR